MHRHGSAVHTGWVRVLEASSMNRRPAQFLACVGPSLVSVGVMIAVWTPPISSLVGRAAVAVGEVLPKGRVWRAPGPSSSTGPPELHDAANFTRWLGDSAWLVLVLVMAARLALWWGIGRAHPRGPRTHHRFGGWAEMLSALGWCLAAALAWRFAWGLQYDRLVAGRTSVPVALGGISVVSMWVGSAIGHVAVLLVLLRRPPAEGECTACGYPLSAKGARCPECGRIASGVTDTPPTRRLSLSAAVLALLMLATPYLASWLSRLVPWESLDWVFRRLPSSW